MRQLRRIARRFLGDVDRAADGRRAGRTAAAQHRPLIMLAVNLLQSVDARQGRKDRMRIDEKSAIMAVESVDAHLRGHQFWQSSLDPHAGLERKPCADTASVRFRNSAAPARHQRRRFAPQRPSGWPRRPLGPSKCRLHHLEIQFEVIPVRASPFPPARRVPQRARTSSVSSPSGRFSENSVPTRRSWCRGAVPVASATAVHRKVFMGFTVHDVRRKIKRRCSSSASPRPTHRHTDFMAEECRQQIFFIAYRTVVWPT